MKIPKVVKIGAHQYKTVFQTDLKSDENYKGFIHFRSQEIRIDPAQPPSMLLATFMHEVIHAIDDCYGCKLGEDNISRVGEGLAEFLINSCGIEFDWSDIEEVDK